MPYAIVLPKIPTRLTVGDSVSWKWSDSSFPATSWTLVYTLINSDFRVQITATADGSEHLVEVTTATASSFMPGRYDWQAHVSDGASQRYLVDSGVLEIVSDFATNLSGYDGRTHVKKVLDVLEAAIEGRASKTQLEQSVGGIAIKHMMLEDQVRMRDRYKIKYQKELAATGQGSSWRTIKPRFAN